MTKKRKIEEWEKTGSYDLYLKNKAEKAKERRRKQYEELKKEFEDKKAHSSKVYQMGYQAGYVACYKKVAELEKIKEDIERGRHNQKVLLRAFGIA